MITFSEYVAEVLQQCQDGLITEREMAINIKKAASWEGMSGVQFPTHDLDEDHAKYERQIYEEGR